VATIFLGCQLSSSRAPILGRPPASLRDGCASLDPATTRTDLAPTRNLGEDEVISGQAAA
jgi:hypothetical protein